jgi:predicted DNA-binding transcriptional regulator YafY
MKQVTRPQYYRIKRIVELLREGRRTGALPNSRDFMRELEVSRRTVARDLDFLLDEENAPIEYDARRHSYYITDDTYTLPPVRLSRREIFSFAIARKVLANFEGTALAMDMRSVLDKIGDSLEGHISLAWEGLTDRYSVLAEDYVRVNAAVWQAVARHLDAAQVIEMVYEKFNGDQKVYRVEPYHLLAYHGNWYLLAYNGSAGRVETFALSRIKELNTTGQSFKRPPDFNARALFQDGFGITQGERVIQVRLRFSRNVAVYIKEREWHPSQQMRGQPDGSLEMRLTTSGRKELIRWILSWMPDVEVLEPPELRKRVAEKLRQGLENLGG